MASNKEVAAPAVFALAFLLAASCCKLNNYSLFVWLVADGWCWFVLREKYCWLIGDGWFILREKYCWLVTDKPNEQGANPCGFDIHSCEIYANFLTVLYTLCV
jgi:hypothetical protein